MEIPFAATIPFPYAKLARYDGLGARRFSTNAMFLVLVDCKSVHRSIHSKSLRQFSSVGGVRRKEHGDAFGACTIIDKRSSSCILLKDVAVAAVYL
jgi:hypothetical protein